VGIRHRSRKAALASPITRSGELPRRTPEVRRGLVFTTVSLALLMMSIDSTIVATALHAIEHGLGASINWAGWTITAYLLGFTLMLPITSKLSDRYGRRRVFLWSVIVFTLASLCCGFASDIYMLIALRGIQAAGGAGFTPSATGIVVDHFGDARDRAVGLFGSIFPTGAMIGPIFGGLFVSYWSWRGVFFVNVPIGILLVVLCLRYVPADPPITKGHLDMDAMGMALLGVGLLASMLGVAYLGEKGSQASSPAFLGPTVLGVLSIAMFVRHIRRAREPFVAPRLIYGASFGTVNLVNAVFGGVATGVITLIPLYAADRYGIDALRSGTLLTAEGIAAIAFSGLGVILLRRTGYRRPLYAGCSLIAVGTFLLTVHLRGIPSYGWLVVAALLIGIGAGAISPASRNAGLQLEPDQSATLAALRTMSMEIGTIVTVSIATAFIAKGHDAGIAEAWIFAVLAGALAVSIPIVNWIPEHRGSW
jgi:EmrB/QacA subfamily drug resistance transporter